MKLCGSMVKAVLIAAFCLFMVAGTQSFLLSETIDVDEILLETGSLTDPALADLVPRVEMSFNSTEKLLTVVLSNQSSYEGDPDAGHLLTGLGFNLPTGVIIEDAAGRDSNVALYGISEIVDPAGGTGLSLSQDDWGYANNVSGGHFVTPAVLDVSTVLSCTHSDAAYTFAGNPATNALMHGFEYGLQGLSPTPGHSTKKSIKNAVELELYLSGPQDTVWEDLIDHIQDNPVIVAFGSPTISSLPEPATVSMGLALAVFAAICYLRRRRPMA